MDDYALGHGLTQADCVAWDESNNIDLRDLDSPHDNRSPRYCFDDDDEEEMETMEGSGGEQFSTVNQENNFMEQDESANKIGEETKRSFGNEENIFGVVRSRKNRRKRRRGDMKIGEEQHRMKERIPLTESKANRRRSVDITEGGGNKALAAMLKEISTPASKNDANATRPHQHEPTKSSLSEVKEENVGDLRDDNDGTFGGDSGTLVTKDTASSAKSDDLRNKVLTPPPPESMVKTSSKSPAESMDDYDFEFTMEDIHEMDAYVQQTQAEQEISATPTEPLNTASTASTTSFRSTKPVQVDKQMDGKVVQTKGLSIREFSQVPSQIVSSGEMANTEEQHVKTEDEPPDQHDEFDFPDFDIAALDETVADYCSSSTRIVSQSKGDKSLMELSDGELLSMVPPSNVIVSNKQRTTTSKTSQLTFDRYLVIRAKTDETTYTRVLVVSLWDDSMREERQNPSDVQLDRLRPFANKQGRKGDGLIFLRGEWYHSMVTEGDVIHICSIIGQFETGVDALPLMMHTTPPAKSLFDDLALVIHPDLLLTPTTISETVTCNRRAVLKTRLGSTGFSCK